MKDLHSTLIRLLNELLPWEPKLVKAHQRNRYNLFDIKMIGSDESTVIYCLDHINLKFRFRSVGVSLLLSFVCTG